MITIIKHGKNHHDLQCPSCKCEFEYDDVDIRGIKGFYDAIIAKDKPHIYCPECGNYISVKW